MGLVRSVLCTIYLLFIPAVYAGAQGLCPPNIGFENGSFDNWNCAAGTVAQNGDISVLNVAPLPYRHTVIQNTFPQQLDPYGNFPVNCPNGSQYSIKLGNSDKNSQAERASYTFQVPAGQNEYSLIYNYAVVFENPNHLDYEQPKFTAKVYDVNANEYLACGAFEHIASSNLPGFQQSNVDPNVVFKPWSPVTMKLVNCAGKLITIEFTTNDCSRGGHFGYAYIDVNENCTSPISGNVYCNGATAIKLTAPFGFQGYRWFTEDFSTLLGTSHTLDFSPVPPVGTRYALEITPYQGVGCLDTLYTTIQYSTEAFALNINNPVEGCSEGVNLTLPNVTSGSTSGLFYSYHTDAEGLHYVPTPTVVTTSGTYYIKGVNSSGCTDIKPVNVLLRNVDFTVKNPPPACYPSTISIDDPTITAGSDPALTFTYWKDANQTIPITNKAISESGTYYIRAMTGFCTLTKPVIIEVRDIAKVFKVNDQTACKLLDLASPQIIAGSQSGLSYSYWQNANATTPQTPIISNSGQYFIRATDQLGCFAVKLVNITVIKPPDVTITNPPEVTAPATVDITNAINTALNLDVSYWMNPQATVPISNPQVIRTGGTYYIKTTAPNGCFSVDSIKVTILIPPDPKLLYPNIFSPNNDGVNDAFKIMIVGYVKINSYRIFNRWGQEIYHSADPSQGWGGWINNSPAPLGTYYWVLDYVNLFNHQRIAKHGAITLIR